MERKTKIMKSRVGFIDELRGLCIILMVLYHLFFDLVYIYGVNIPIFSSMQMDFLRDFFAGVFIFISGVSCRFSHNNIKRGAICFLIGMALTLITIFLMPDQAIKFGILHLLGICMILFGLLKKVIDKIRFPIIGILICVLFYSLTMNIKSGTIASFLLPTQITSNPYLFPFGITTPGFFSSDYFPLFPWMFVFFAGTYFGVYIANNRFPKFLYKTHIRPLAFVGRHTLIVYLAHQPIVYGGLFLIFNYIVPIFS